MSDNDIWELSDVILFRMWRQIYTVILGRLQEKLIISSYLNAQLILKPIGRG